MKQLIQNFKTGNLSVEEVPAPALSEGMVLIENKCSLISSGTERSTVQVAKASLIGKAKQRPDLVAQVIANFKKEGFKATLEKVRTKLDTLKPMGYSSAGIVMASLDKNGKFTPGDRVACAGQGYASHADINSVPENLVVKLPDNVSYQQAAFTTLGAIALQGVRQAEPRLGERVCVIGLGLLGQLTGQLLRANGCDVFGIDLSDRLIELSKKSGFQQSFHRSDPALMKACENFTNGYGFDSVIITAAAPTNDPIVLSTEIIRKKGRIIIVGAVKMDIPRDPHFYRKELDLRISCSYGPGRYDSSYEEGGIDYPFAYVRWTEQRNMEAFLNLVSSNSVKLEHLISHNFTIDQAEAAYDIVLGKNPEPHLGIVLSYPDHETKFHTSRKYQPVNEKKLNVGFIGAGNFAQSYLIPNAKLGNASLDTVVTTKGISSKNVAEKFGFGNGSSDLKDVLGNDNINTVFIATPHGSHADLTIKCLSAKKHVFVEKPLALTLDQLNLVADEYYKGNNILMVGFNRRFAPVCVAAKSAIQDLGEPVIVNIRVNAGFIDKEHWTQHQEIGGGRIIGEACHFIDLMQYFTGSEPVKVYADSISTSNVVLTADDNVCVIIRFANGSVGNLTYVASGDKSLPKELIEVFCGGQSFVINDFREGFHHKNNRVTKIKSAGKGHREEVSAFLTALANDLEAPISFRSLYLTTLATFKIIDSLKSGIPQEIEYNG